MSSQNKPSNTRQPTYTTFHAVPRCIDMPHPAPAVIKGIKNLAASMRKELQSGTAPHHTRGQRMIKVKIEYLAKTSGTEDSSVSNLCAELRSTLHNPEGIIALCDTYLTEVEGVQSDV